MKYSFLLLLVSLLLLFSCTTPKKFARRFVKYTKGAKVALYIPDALIKKNMRIDVPEEVLDTIPEENREEYLRSFVRVVDSINDEMFFSILISSFEESLKAYDLELCYWENDTTMPDSLHWIVDIQRIEIQECTAMRTYAEFIYGQGYEYDCPFDYVNVASWFELSNGITDDFVFTEHNYESTFNGGIYLNDKGLLSLDCSLDTISVSGFYRFAVALGKLYAGYCFDYFMNDNISKKCKIPFENIKKYRYDPYEYILYYDSKDGMIRIDGQ